jgi:hypothetical protein
MKTLRTSSCNANDSEARFLAQQFAITVPCQFYGICGNLGGFYLSRMTKKDREWTICVTFTAIHFLIEFTKPPVR